MAAGNFSSLARNAARGDVFHVIDTETTGHAPPGSRVIEVACLSLRHGEVVGRFETLVDPGVPIPPFITRLTGIKPAMLVGQPGPVEAMARFKAYLDALPGHFVAHNAGFDDRFLRHEFAQAGLEWPFNGRYCTVRLARHVLPKLRRHNLDSLVAHFGLTVAARHRAMGDVEVTAEAFWRMVQMLEGGGGGAGAMSAVVAAAPVAPPPLPPGAWRGVLHAVGARSRTLAAMLDQHGALMGVAADGVVEVALKPPFRDRLDDAKLATLGEAVQAVFGPAAAVRVVAPAGAPA